MIMHSCSICQTVPAGNPSACIRAGHLRLAAQPRKYGFHARSSSASELANGCCAVDSHTLEFLARSDSVVMIQLFIQPVSMHHGPQPMSDADAQTCAPASNQSIAAQRAEEEALAVPPTSHNRTRASRRRPAPGARPTVAGSG